MPNKIGPYILGRTLGIGTFSKVKIAIHEPTGKRVAVKILNKQKLQQMEMEHKKDREIEILRMLNHPHVIRLYEVLDTPTDIFVVTEFVSNGELFDYIVTHGRLPEKDARRFFQQIIAGVTYCHAKGVVHRDLKPENLLLDEHNNLRIADFGLSNQVRDGFFLKTSCGSPNYAAPEVISGDLYAGPEVDVWSCGVILYALLCGTLPFDDENIPNLFRKIKSGQYRIPAYLPRGAAELIEGMLQVNPMERISVDEIRVHPWFKRNLPAYLDADPAAFITREKRIDPKVMSAVVRKLPCPESEVREALAFGPRLLTQRRYRMGNYRRLREIAMAYHLLFDQQSKAQIASDINDVLPMVNGSISKRLINMNSLDVSSPEQQIELHQHDQDRNFRLLTRTFEENKQFLVQWLVGLWTSLNPGQMMEHVLASLIHLQMEWHIQTPYRVIARSKLSRAERANLEEKLARKRRRRHSRDLYDDLSDPIMRRRGSTEAKTDDEDGSISYQSTIDVDSMDDDEWNEWNSFEIKIQLQLYSTRPLTGSELNRVSTPTKPRGEPRVSVVNSGFYGSRYLLDIQKLSGDTFPFLDLCAGLMQQIKYLPPR